MSGPHHRRPQPPVPELELLVIDGDNLLHRVRGMRDDAGLHWLLPRLRAWRPAEVQVLLMLDGSPGPGMGRRQQAAPGIQMQHSGRLDADTAIVELVRARGYAERMRTVVVTDDRQLSDRVRYGGVLVRRLDWLIDLLVDPTPMRRRPSRVRRWPRQRDGLGPASPTAGSGVARGRRRRASRARPSVRTRSHRPAAVGIGGGKPPRARTRRRPSNATRTTPANPGSRAVARPPNAAIPSARPGTAADLSRIAADPLRYASCRHPIRGPTS